MGLIPKSHPRYQSLLYREVVISGFKNGLTSLAGLTAHGRGETFDYLIGEATLFFAESAIEAAAALLLLSKFPVISVNGNTAALAGRELVNLSELLDAPIEINLFHPGKDRERAIVKHLKFLGAKKILTPGDAFLPFLRSNRRMISREGQKKADVVMIPLEDGDRTEALIKMGKKVITIDLNPFSRTAQKANITIVDHVGRCLPILIKKIHALKKETPETLQSILGQYDNDQLLKDAIFYINQRLTKLSYE